MQKFLKLFFIGACFYPATAHAEDRYCDAPGVVLYDGADLTIDWTVTTNKARTIQRVGQTKPSLGCSRDFRTNGTILSREIIKPATLGWFRAVNKYRVIYGSDKVGHDEIAYKTTWEFGGRTSSAIVRIKVRVIDRPV